MQRYRILITGAGGFVGSYLAAELRRSLEGAVILATSRRSNIAQIGKLDVTSLEDINTHLKSFAPTHVVHLAGITTLSLAQRDRASNWEINFSSALNVADTILDVLPSCTLVFVSSGQVYGKAAERGGPLSEGLALYPLNEYAAAKAAAELALAARTTRGLKLIRLRPFNHIGVGQIGEFVIPNFAKQIAEIEAGARSPTIKVGNLEVKRDFLDVRDVAIGYRRAIERSEAIESGTVINIASGKSISIKYLLDRLLSFTEASISVELEGSRVRENEIFEYVACNKLARELLSWSPQIQIDDTLLEVLKHFRRLTSEV